MSVTAVTSPRSGWWTEHVVPRLVDLSLSQEPISRLRGRVCRGLHGRVLEIGFGSGLNLPHLGDHVAALDVVEPSDLAWRRSVQRRDQTPVPVERIGLDGRRLAAVAASYDACLCTFSLCTIPDPALAVAEMARVLRPGGRLHVLEHGLAPDAGVRSWQRRLEPMQRRLAGGCHLTRDPVTLVDADERLTWAGVEHDYLGAGPAKPFAYLTWGTATRG